MVTGVILGGWCLGVALAGPLGTPKIPPILTPILGQIHVKSASKLYLYGGHSGGVPRRVILGWSRGTPKTTPNWAWRYLANTRGSFWVVNGGGCCIRYHRCIWYTRYTGGIACARWVAFRYRYHHGTRDGSLRGQYPGG